MHTSISTITWKTYILSTRQVNSFKIKVLSLIEKTKWNPLDKEAFHQHKMIKLSKMKVVRMISIT